MTNEELAVKIQNGELELIGQLWEQNKGILHMKSFNLYTLYRDRCASSGVDLDDIIQVGYFALCDAVQAFDADGEYKFTSYIKYPFLNRFRALLGIRSSKRNPLDCAASLNEAAGGEEDSTERIDLFADPKSGEAFENVLDDLFQSELRNALDEAISMLPESRAAVIRARWLEEKPQGQIAAEMGKKPQYIHQLEYESFRRLQKDRKLQAFHKEVLSNLAYKHTGLQWFKDTGDSCVERAVIRTEEIMNTHGV